jgi:uncharacterized protein (TIGR02453 family)
MLQVSTLDFLKKLEKNNNKAWFDEHRKEYEQAKKDYEQFITDLYNAFSKVEPSVAGKDAKKTIFRIFRDVRFSKDKTPYKSHLGAYISRAGRKAPDAGYYIHIEPGKSFVAAGLWMPDAALLKAARQEIDYNFKEFTSILNKASFKKLFKKMEGEALKTLPQGYAADNPAIEYLKLKSFIVSTPLADKDITSKSFTNNVVKIFLEVKPLVDFLNRAID